MPDPQSSRKSNWNQNPLVWIVVALVVWGPFMAIGTAWYLEQMDWRRPLIVIGCVGLFLGIWGWLLFAKRKR